MAQKSRQDRIAELLRRAGTAHHQAFAHVNGEDPEWPEWYAGYLSGPLGAELGVELERGRLAQDLAAVEAERQERAPGEEWSSYYGNWLVRRYGEAG